MKISTESERTTQYLVLAAGALGLLLLATPRPARAVEIARAEVRPPHVVLSGREVPRTPWIEHVRPFFRLTPLQMLAVTAYGEARGEGSQGMQAVINTIHNRSLHPLVRFADRAILDATNSPYHAIVLKRWQFSCFNLGDPNRGRLLALTGPEDYNREIVNNRALAEAHRICESLRDGTLEDLTRGADHFFSIHIERPEWTARMVNLGRIGRHEFWSEPPHISESPQRFRQ